ncbi:hypothetical protein BDQ17DRAFT_1325916 [Cyathus striatus]|nr:hypothetical protein BDQ17DRAFT_1325916 [Cyathus striatus]
MMDKSLKIQVYGLIPFFSSRWIDTETGRRSDVPHHFIYSQRKAVKRVIFEGDHAVGVEYVNDATSDPESDRSIFVAWASRLVVISAGASGSPAILERSGIGQRDILEKHGVDLKIDLPGAGESYQDHHAMIVPYLASDDADTLYALFRGDEVKEKDILMGAEQTMLYEKGTRLIARNGFDAGIKMRTSKDDLKILGPAAFKSRWDSFFADSDKLVIWLGVGSVLLTPLLQLSRGQYQCTTPQAFQCGLYTDYPESTGSVHISSSEDANAPYDFNTSFFKYVYTVEDTYLKTLFLDGSEATWSHDRTPDVHAPNIVYSAEDDLAIEQYIKKYAWNLCYEASSGRRVIDSQLKRIRNQGVKGCRPSDMSIAPQNVGANNYSTALVIGEKAASIISDELSTTAQMMQTSNAGNKPQYVKSGLVFVITVPSLLTKLKLAPSQASPAVIHVTMLTPFTMTSTASTMATSTSQEMFDIIFAGGGATACVTAGRIAAANPTLKILVLVFHSPLFSGKLKKTLAKILEAGPHTHGLQEYTQPGRYFSNLRNQGHMFTFHTANPSKAVAGRSIVVASGRCVGGGSGVNSYLIEAVTAYTRAAASDYDDWENLYGNTGWSSRDLIPLLQKVASIIVELFRSLTLFKAESYQSPTKNSTHGTLGPIKVSLADTEINLAEQFINVIRKYDLERQYAEDVNDFSASNSYGRWARYIDLQSGTRSDTAEGYIYNLRNTNNLKILDRSRVVRIIFEGTRAVGVEYVGDVIGDETGRSQSFVVQASRLVVVSAGAFGSPAILERSGIGAQAVLEQNSIPVVVNLPGVGQNYMDHNVNFTHYFVSEDADTLDVLFRGSEEEIEPYVNQWKANGTGLMAHNAYDAGVKLRPTEKELQELGPEFSERWNTYFRDAPDKPVMILFACTAYLGKNPAVPRRKYINMCYFICYPIFAGHVHITSGLDPYGKLDFHAGYLEHPADMAVLRWTYKKSREYARRMNSYQGESPIDHPHFPQGSEGSAKAVNKPVDIQSSEIYYTAADNKAIDEYHRKMVETTWHSSLYKMGTCAMKPRAQGGVVDARLNVYGTSDLKVADLSICPGNVGANTYNTAIAVGEKAALIIAEDLGIRIN